MAMSTYDTGDNPAEGDLLTRTIQFMKDQGCRLIRTISDVKTYAAFMNSPDGLDFYLVAKGSKVWKGIVSTQLALLYRAAPQPDPLILALWDGPIKQGPKLYLFNPQRVMDDSDAGDVNVRFGVEMLNFPLNWTRAVRVSRMSSEWSDMMKHWLAIKSARRAQRPITEWGRNVQSS